MQPLVLPLDVGRGWREATETRRAVALGFPVLLVFWAVLPQLGEHTAWLNDASAYLGGVVCYAVARVFRPHTGYSLERIVRHGFASLSVSCAINFFVVIRFAGQDSDPATWWPIVIATAGLFVTVPWGLVAVLVRATSRDQPRVWPSPVTT